MSQINFTNFHNKTVANFTVCDRPDRNPDFVSDSGSEYWNAGDGVIRAADHWVGDMGCTAIRSCLWSIDAAGYGERVGFAAYDSFRIRKAVPIWHHVADADRELAQLILDHNGVPASLWTKGSGRHTKKRDIPVWASETFKDMASFEKRIGDRKARQLIIADTVVCRRVLKQGRIKVGEKLA